MFKKIAVVASTAAVALGVTGSLAVPAYASATGSKGAVAFTVSGGPCDLNLSAHSKSSFFGHLQVVNIVRTGIETTRTTSLYNSPTGQNPKFSNGNFCVETETEVCVIGWRENANRTYTNVGEPCFEAE
jgi:hypothetical protein